MSVFRFVKSLAVCLCAIVSMNCLAEEAGDIGFGNCGFAGPEQLTNESYCKQFSENVYDDSMEKEAAIRLLTMAWDWLTSDEARENAINNRTQSGLNEGQKFEPKFRLKAHSDDIYLTVAYEF